MKKRDYWLIATILVIAVMILLLHPDEQSEDGSAYIRIELDGQEYKRVRLDDPQTVTVLQENGETNTVEVTSDGAVMLHSSCRNQICVKQGKVTTENYQVRPTQGFIICLPNKVTVELVPGRE